MEVNIVNKSNNQLPEYKTSLSSGMDIRANLEDPIFLESMQRSLIPTGLFVEIPAGYEIQIRPRSGLAIQYGLTVLNAPGTIDADYRGEIQVIIINLSRDPQEIVHGDRIAQMVLAKVEKAELKEVEELGETERGSGGFGHTGIQ